MQSAVSGLDLNFALSVSIVKELGQEYDPAMSEAVGWVIEANKNNESFFFFLKKPQT